MAHFSLSHTHTQGPLGAVHSNAPPRKRANLPQRPLSDCANSVLPNSLQLFRRSARGRRAHHDGRSAAVRWSARGMYKYIQKCVNRYIYIYINIYVYIHMSIYMYTMMVAPP